MGPLEHACDCRLKLTRSQGNSRPVWGTGNQFLTSSLFPLRILKLTSLCSMKKITGVQTKKESHVDSFLRLERLLSIKSPYIAPLQPEEVRSVIAHFSLTAAHSTSLRVGCYRQLS